MPYRTRVAGPEDALRIAEVHAASRVGVYGGRIPDEILHLMSQEERIERWRAWLGEPEIVTLVAELDGEIAGFCTVRATTDPDQDPAIMAEMPTLYVHPDLWRRGVGGALCAEAIERARGLQYKAMTLWVLDLNAGAQDFYGAQGFTRDGAVKVDDGPTPAPYMAHRFRMEL